MSTDLLLASPECSQNCEVCRNKGKGKSALSYIVRDSVMEMKNVDEVSERQVCVMLVQ